MATVFVVGVSAIKAGLETFVNAQTARKVAELLTE